MTKPASILIPSPSSAGSQPLVRAGFFLAAGIALCLAGWAGVAKAQSPRLPGGAAAATRLATPAPAPVQRQADYIVAIVNSEPITNNEVRARLKRAEQQLAQQGGNLPPPAELARQVLEVMISEKAQVQFARDSGLKVDDAAVDEAELNVARQNQIDRAELRRRLAQDGVPLAQFREELRNQLLLGRLRERDNPARAQVSENEIEQFLREQTQASAAAPVDLNLAMVLVAVPENSTAAQVTALRARAQSVADRARAGADFAALVREFSEGPDRGRNDGGELGLRSADRYPSLFVEATQALAAGQIAGPVRSGAGFHILKVIEKRQPSTAVTVPQTRARHILLVPTPALTTAAARTQLADFKRRIQAGQADFAALAREHSQDGSARAGGDLGWAGPGQFVPEFEETMRRLKPNEISEPLVSRFGVHLIQVLERRDYVLNASEQRELARNLLLEQKSEEAFKTWVQDVRGRAYVEIREQPSL